MPAVPPRPTPEERADRAVAIEIDEALTKLARLAANGMVELFRTLTFT